ncbi:MAG: magnesium transporter, partial [Spirochaetales bacterium]|nr:magnesium transporter [Spirochaetales bacterium]
MDTDLLEEQIIDLIENKKWDEVKERIVHWRAPDISTFLMDLGHNEDLLSYFRMLPIELAAEVFSELNTDTQEYILANITDEQIKKILLELEVDDRTELFEDIRQYDTQKLLELLPQEERTETMHLLDYPESSVGRLMTTDFIAVRASWTITECLTYIRRDENKEKLSDVIYVTDNNNRLVDYVNISDFIFGDDESSVESLLDYNVVKLSPTDDREKAIELINHYHLIAVPVTDEHNILIGTVTFDDVMDVYREEVTEDFHLTSAIQPLERSYVTTRALSLFAKRTPWLLILVVVNLLSGTVIAAFEGIIAKSISLIAFLPLLVASAGNAGSQSST